MPRKKSPEFRNSSSLTLLGAGTTTLPSSPDAARLEVFANSHPGSDYEVRFACPEFTSLCPITGQPDFGAIVITYVPGRWCLESKSLKLYLGSFRNQGTFHEAAVNRIRDDLSAAVKPRRLTVEGRFRPRGGIAIRVTAHFESGPASGSRGRKVRA